MVLNANFDLITTKFTIMITYSLLYPVNERDNYVDMRDSTKALYTTLH